MTDTALRCVDCGRRSTDDDEVDPMFGACRDVRACAARAERVSVRRSDGTTKDPELFVVSKRAAPFSFAHTIYNRAELEALRAQIDRVLA